jgi:hypothetical protein
LVVLRPLVGENAGVTIAIIVLLALVGIGIVIDRLFWLRRWLNTPLPGHEFREPPDENV